MLANNLMQIDRCPAKFCHIGPFCYVAMTIPVGIFIEFTFVQFANRVVWSEVRDSIRSVQIRNP